MNTEAAERKARSLRVARCKEKVQKGGTVVQSGGACKVVRRSPGPDPGCSAREGTTVGPDRLDGGVFQFRTKVWLSAEVIF